MSGIVHLGVLWPTIPGGLCLVSASPRRAELLRQIGASFRVIPPTDEAEIGGEGDPRDLVLRLAEQKARSVVSRAGERFLLAADTVVVGKTGVFGKPTGPLEAKAMLRDLSGRPHRVITGIYALDREESRHEMGAEETRVFFRRLTEKEIEEYTSTGEPLDKAGAYGIQGKGALLIERIEGCYFNVVGLPLVRTREILGKLLFSGTKKGS